MTVAKFTYQSDEKIRTDFVLSSGERVLAGRRIEFLGGCIER